MANRQLRENLFRNHLADLKDVAPTVQNLFVCPICLSKFSHNDLEEKEKRLTVGHVWPGGIRSKSGSTTADDQRVLLCDHCNSMAGTRGEKQMQLREKIKEGEKTGHLYEERRVQVLLSPNERPIHLRSRITRSADKIQTRLNFELDAKGMQWARNNPNEQQRFLEWADSGEACAVLIPPHHEHRHDLAKVGWIGSAYLLAFYTFGYRYIFHKDLNPVREYILSSFEGTVPERLELPKSVSLHERTTTPYFKDPQIALIVPLDGESFVHLQVSFLDYYIKLPFHFVQEALRTLVFSQPDVAETLPEIMGQEGANIYIPVSCNKRDVHDCEWDYVLGKPIPALHRRLLHLLVVLWRGWFCRLRRGG
jgi:hypothetical protein